MITSDFTRLAKGVALAALVSVAGTAARAAAFDFHVDLTGTLPGGAAPYGINFQLTQGSGQTNIGTGTTVTLSNFSFVGGSASGSPDFSFGTLASGSVASGFTLKVDGTGTYSDILQGFTAGTSLIGFNVHVDTNTGVGFSPDGFRVLFLDANGIYAISGNPDDSFLALDINTDSSVSSVQTFSGSGVGASVSAVPEPSTYGLMGAGAVAAAALVRRRRKAA